MTKKITCCEWVERIKEFISENNFTDEENYRGLEFINKAALKIINRRVKEWVNFNGKPEPMWTHDSDYLFCEKCKKWFEQKEESQIKMVRAQIEKEKAEGKYYGPRNPKTYEGTIMEDTIKKMREGNNQNVSSPPFGKSPQE